MLIGAIRQIACLLRPKKALSPALAASGAEVDAARTRSTLAEKAWVARPDGRGRAIDPDQQPPAGDRGHDRAQHSIALGPGGFGATGGDRTDGAAEQRYEAALLDIQSALGEALARLAARQANALVAGKPFRKHGQALKSVTADYAQGRGDLATALDAQRRVHDLELAPLELELDEQTMLAAIERLIGGEL